MPLKLTEIREAQKILDNAHVPKKDRIVYDPKTNSFYTDGYIIFMPSEDKSCR